MQVTQLSAEGLRHEFKVVIPFASIQEQVETRLAEVGQNVRLPGFRPGKVPHGLLRKKYGPSVTNEVVEGAINDGARKALEDHNIRPAVQPKVEVQAFDEGVDLEFTVAVEALPEVAVMDLATLELEKMVAEVPAEAVDETLANIAERNGTSEPLSEGAAAELGNVAVIDFLGKVDGVPFDGGKGEDFDLPLGSGTFIPGFEDQLVGAKAGEQRLVKVTFPESYGAEALAGKAAEFDVTIKALKAKTPAAIDDELAKAVGLDSLTELKDAISGEIKRDYDIQSRNHLKRRLLDALAAKHEFQVPQSMVDAEFDAIWAQFEEERKQGRVDADDAGKSDEVLREEYRTIAERRVRLGLVMAEIGRANKVNVNQEDLNRAVMNEARRFPGQERLVFQYYQQNPDAMNGLKAPVFEEKVVDFILELAKITERTVSVEELRKDPDAADLGDAAAPAGEAEGETKPKSRKKKTQE